MNSTHSAANNGILSEEFISSKLISSEKLQKVFSIKVKHDGFSEMLKNKLSEYRKQYSDKHFRVGKAPLSLLKQKFFDSAVQEVSSEIIKNFVSKTDEKYIGTPDIKIKQVYVEDSDKKDPEFEVIFTSKPSVPEIDLSKYKIKDPNIEVSDADVQKDMEAWANNNKKAVELSAPRKSKIGDTLNVSMSLMDKSDNAQSFDIVLGEGTFIKEIEDKLVDQDAGASINHTIDIPKNLSKNPSLPSDIKQFAGKKLGVNLTVNKIMETKNHEVDLDMAKHFGCSSLESCKAKFREMLEKKVQESKFIYKKHQLESQFNQNINIEIPDTLINREKQIMWHGLLSKFQVTRKEMFSIEEIKEIFKKIQDIGFLTKHTFDDVDNEYQRLAKRRISFFFIIQKFQNDMDVSLVKSEIEAEKARKASEFKGGITEALKHYEKKEELAKLENTLLENKIVNEVLVKCNNSSAKMSIEDLSNELEKMIKDLEPKIDFSAENNIDSEKAATDKKSDSSEKITKKSTSKKTTTEKKSDTKTKKSIKNDNEGK